MTSAAVAVAQDRYGLLLRCEEVLLAAGPTLFKHDRRAYYDARALYARLLSRGGRVKAESAAYAYSHRSEPKEPPKPVSLELPQPPEWAAGKFPFNPPKASLRDEQRAIEEMLAPLSDRRHIAATRWLP